MDKTTPTQLELLAPARNAEIAIAAIDHGADAVYIGAPAYGARSAATNSVEDIERVVEYAHRFNARVYVTLNTILYDDELDAVELLIARLYKIGVDALIVQDMGILRLSIPPIALHASTQCDTRTPEQARYLQDLGMSQIVIARESSLEQMREICSAVDVPIEAFVHGALCVSYSGDCHAGQLTMGRSANRGMCPQICRLCYDLTDERGNVLIRQKHLLALRDLNLLGQLEEMADAGVRSFKIEGRLKDITYVKNVVSAYSRALDKICAASSGRYTRSSCGRVEHRFMPQLDDTFNRGYTRYFFDAPLLQDTRMATFDAPNRVGVKLGRISRILSANAFRLESANLQLSNGDGLGYMDKDGVFKGFRLNRYDNGTLHAAPGTILPPVGTMIYRTLNYAFDTTLKQDKTALRQIGVTAILRRISPSMISLEMEDERGNCVTVTADSEHQESRSPQIEMRREVMAKTGNTIYRVDEIYDLAGDNDFIRRSVLADLRRDAIQQLDNAQRVRYKYEYRRAEDPSARIPQYSSEEPGSTHLSYHRNISNKKAAETYRMHGSTGYDTALEVHNDKSSKPRVAMSTRYCLRRELGSCLKEKEKKYNLPQNLFLTSQNNIKFALEFDCKRCMMRLIHQPKK